MKTMGKVNMPHNMTIIHFSFSKTKFKMAILVPSARHKPNDVGGEFNLLYQNFSTAESLIKKSMQSFSFKYISFF